MGIFIIIGFEIALTIAIVICWLHEDKLIAFEHRIYNNIKNKGG